MKFSEKYRHVGYSAPSVPEGWRYIVEKAVMDIEKIMWPRWIPMFLKRWIHYLATGNSVVRIKYKWAYKLRTIITKGSMIQDIKDKYAGLRIYYYGNDEIEYIVDKAIEECDNTCEICASQKDVQNYGKGWIYNFCIDCRNKKDDEQNKKKK